MKIALIGPGIMEIPPNGWGAVEQLIWDNYLTLTKLGVEVVIINDPDQQVIIDTVNNGLFDVVHIHYDKFYEILPYLKTKVKIISSHYPYLQKKEMWAGDGYNHTFSGIISSPNVHIFVSSKEDKEMFVKSGVSPNLVWISKLGVNVDTYTYYEAAINKNQTLCLGKVTHRKNQHLIQDLPNITFIGKYDDMSFRNELQNYIGELPREELNKTISTFGNMILLSEGENATPLVLKEGLVCGLGIVVSECCSVELDRAKPFIHVVPDSKLRDIEYVKEVINDNLYHSFLNRAAIRSYGIEEFGMESLMVKYKLKLESLL